MVAAAFVPRISLVRVKVRSAKREPEGVGIADVRVAAVRPKMRAVNEYILELVVEDLFE